MATPLTADVIVAALKAEGVKVAEHTGWRTHNRNSKGPWGPVRGVVIHHTAGTNSLELCYDGRSDLPGPLCHTHLAKTGVATMVGNGRANHAGTFAANAVTAMTNESATHPRPDAAEPVDGNAIAYGLEVENKGDGTDPYPAVQYEAAVRWAAALCRAHGWSAESVIGHREGTRRKTDPSFSMTAFRTSVAERLTHPASWNPNDQEEDPMPLTADQAAQLKALHDNLLSIGSLTEKDPKGNRIFHGAGYYLAHIHGDTRAIQTAEAAQTAAITALAGLIGTGVDTAAVVTAVQQAIAAAVVKVDVSVGSTTNV
jgi:hypothetical protein